MNSQSPSYCLWVHRELQIASFHPIQGYELLCFDSRDNLQAKVHILIQSGFRFQ